MFRKVLIANRGEIAVRIIQACRELGVVAAVGYSEADRHALPVLQADEAYCLGPAAPRQSYLSLPAILQAARQAGAEAVHPGYGFLSEDPALAEACAAAGLVFIGPPAPAMRLLGDKAAAKTLAERLGVPTIPGYHGADDDEPTLQQEAGRLGFPLLVKAAAGGGGRGMRLVRSADELPTALASARREAESAFGSGRLLLERWIERPRHVEVQLIGDQFGQIVHLGERDCSIQRRHQKVIEEAPSPHVDAALRERLGLAAVQLASAAGYANAGTVEFLLDADGRFYFLEVNTRLQVEHPVTEAITGLDLVKLQLSIAAGQPLPFSQAEVAWRGHAIECRLYAEDPSNDFAPSIGRVSRFEPAQGPGIRNDVGLRSGDEVGRQYDPLIAKLIVQADDRAAAVARLEAALARTVIQGVTTNLALLRHLIATPAFRMGRTDTGLVERVWRPTPADEPVPLEALLAVASVELGVSGQSTGPLGPWGAGPWRPGQRRLRLRYQVNGRPLVIDLLKPLTGDDTWTLECHEQRLEALVEPAGATEVVLRLGDRAQLAAVRLASGDFDVDWAGRRWRIDLPAPPTGRLDGAASHEGTAATTLRAPMPGTVVRVAVAEGQRVRARQVLVVLEAMKIEHAVSSPADGLVRRLACGEGDVVDRHAALVEVVAE